MPVDPARECTRGSTLTFLIGKNVLLVFSFTFNANGLLDVFVGSGITGCTAQPPTIMRTPILDSSVYTRLRHLRM